MFFRDRIALHFLVQLPVLGFFFPGLASGFGFFRLFFGFQTHRVGFSACFSLAAHRLLFTFLFQLPVLGFFVCFSVPTPTTWGFLLAFHSLHPDCSSLSCFSFRFWVFSTISRLPHPPRGFFRLFFGSHTHHVGFSACFSLATHIRQRNRHAPIRLLAKQQLSILCLLTNQQLSMLCLPA